MPALEHLTKDATPIGSVYWRLSGCSDPGTRVSLSDLGFLLARARPAGDFTVAMDVGGIVGEFPCGVAFGLSLPQFCGALVLHCVRGMARHPELSLLCGLLVLGDLRGCSSRRGERRWARARG